MDWTKKAFEDKKCTDLSSLLDYLNSFIYSNIQTVDSVTSDLIDLEFFEEIKRIVNSGIAFVFFGRTLRDLKCVITDDECLREHEIFVQYKGPKKLLIKSTGLPHSSIQDQEYSSLHEVVSTAQELVNNLADYFFELQNIDEYCTVVEPQNPSFKEDYRKILLDDRIWLHVEVTPEGLASNVHLVGQSETWQDKLQAGLIDWDHDKDIVANIMSIFDITEFPNGNAAAVSTVSKDKPTVEETMCSICLCNKLPDDPGVPQPICQNPLCGVYYHRNCLLQWLVACSGGRPPAFGVATGNCPACLQFIACDEKDH